MNRQLGDKEEKFSENLSNRKRTGSTWQFIFLLSTIIGIIALTTLLVNIIDSVFGYVIVESSVDPATFQVDGVAIENQSKEQLTSILRDSLSSGAFKKLDNEKSFSERTRNDVFALVEERVLKIEYSRVVVLVCLDL